ncbi:MULTISPECIES: 4-alpha-glucanotransferase [unclassified Lentimonas]|uniref:4-alpha-glucanotransferase n=1 Tax=unclassified Lentimonas TaxID=2630993 RepID=UPI0013243D1C|nr:MULTISPECIES: 4-alpha-glucanotransferase [unclassified Lentimonas]CAA6689787.1 4-alpha-glucanotransferase (amylomaltase) (EC [Lentimonas sp. CC19]CAA6690653.1 4-alpha-glucanotransferase (amylomaltase) (EC [Lentimonas sp. CC10]CAA7068907.1 4-alpha-glucanotransferase (amylomaltase) (EC [Lentimonas sp. CC11]
MTAPLYNWLNTRSSGILLHVSSLPSDTGIGNFGAAAYRYIDFMESAGMRVWQICPLGPTGYGDSPYQCFSAFAGNPYFIDFAPLVAEGLIHADELAPLNALPKDHVDYGALYGAFWPIIRQAYDRFKCSGADHFQGYGSIKAFRKAQSAWIEDFALFLALKSHFDGKCWLEWPAAFRDAEKARKNKLSAEILEDAEAHVFYQYMFYGQLAKLRAYAASKGVEILGDAPIFVALDSSDVWANRALFQLGVDGKPKAVAGVPPDYFSEDGQLWGNPLYDWKVHQDTNFAWWIERIKANLAFYDIVRLDHFRGFESYWSVPATETTARNGKWIKCPGLELFKAIQKACPDAKLVAEDLGVITDEVNELRAATGLPGMAVLQFAFGSDAGNAYLPHNYSRNCVAYSGTHDNDTSLGWYRGLADDSEEKNYLRRYLRVSGEAISWDLVRSAIQSAAHLAVVPLQDLLSLGSEARINTPGAPMGNWQWRYAPEQLDALQAESSDYLKDLMQDYGRSAQGAGLAYPDY